MSELELPTRQYSASWIFQHPDQSASTSTQLHSLEDSRTSLLRGDGQDSMPQTFSLSHPTWRSSPAHAAKDFPDRFQKHEPEDYSRTQKTRRTRPWTNFSTKPQVLRALCLILHLGLVVLHLVLLGISFPHWEHRKVIPLGSQSTAWSIGVPALSQAFITIYSAGILVLTQQLSLRRNLLVPQTLTATHDKSTAWSGLGSSLMSLWRQVYVTASVWGVASITIYLAGISILHISTPTLLTLEAFNNTIQTNLATKRGLPNPDVDTSDSITPVYTYFTQAAPILPLLGQYSQLSTIGVHGNTVYDILPDNRGAGNVTVNSTTFDVSCDVIPNPRAIGGGPKLWNITADPFTDGEGSVQSDFQASLISNNVVRMALFNSKGQRFLTGDNRVLYYSSVNFTDSQGGSGSRVTLNPPMLPTLGFPINSLQAMACRFSSHNGTIIVDAQTKSPVDPPRRKTSSTWGSPQPPSSFHENSNELSTITEWQSVLDEVSTLPGTADACGPSPKCDFLTVLDQFVVQELSIKPDIDPATNPQPRPQLELYQLENALANLTAALQWSTTQLNPGNSSGSTFYYMAFAGQATVSQPQLASRLKLNVLPITVGLAASVVLFMIAFLLTGNLADTPDAIDNTGILQLIWLLRDRPDLLSRISQVERPSADDLRAAGMFVVRLAEDHRLTDYEMARKS